MERLTFQAKSSNDESTVDFKSLNFVKKKSDYNT